MAHGRANKRKMQRDGHTRTLEARREWDEGRRSAEPDSPLHPKSGAKRGHAVRDPAQDELRALSARMHEPSPTRTLVRHELAAQEDSMIPCMEGGW